MHSGPPGAMVSYAARTVGRPLSHDRRNGRGCPDTATKARAPGARPFRASGHCPVTDALDHRRRQRIDSGHPCTTRPRGGWQRRRHRQTPAPPLEEEASHTQQSGINRAQMWDGT